MRMSRRELGSKIITSLKGIRTGFIINAHKQCLTELNKLIILLKDTSSNALPYASLSKFVYEDDDEDLTYFLDFFDEFIHEHVKDNEENLGKLLKILEHLDLAKQQKEALFEEQQSKLQQIERLHIELKVKTEKVEELSEKVDELFESNKNMITNFISILGIFAAILMGAFGAIQGFTSLFEHAAFMPLGKALILSAVGGSSVILILFLLLNGISKLTNRPIANSTKSNIRLKHPTIVATYAIMITIAFSGAALELSDKDIHYSEAGFWWIIPGIWLVLILIYFRKELFRIKE